MTDPMLVWGLALLGIAIVLIVLELFIPSAGVIAGVAVLVAAAGVVCLFRHDTTWGLIGTLIVLIGGPAAFLIGLKLWPETPVGRAMLGEDPPEVTEHRRMEESRQAERARMLENAQGAAITDLRPVGQAQLEDGEKLEVIAESGWIEDGSAVRVTRVEGSQVYVRGI